MNLIDQIIKGLAAVILGLALVSCSDSEDSVSASNTLSGTAATGAAIVGTVEVVGANGVTASATIEVDGSFVVNINGMDAPYILRTVGSSAEYSYASSANIKVNITPLTTIAMFIVGGDVDPSILFDTWTSTSGNITDAEIKTAQAIINANISAQYSANNINPLYYDFFAKEFFADSTGFDAILDSINVSIATGTIEISINGAAPIVFNIAIDISSYDIGGAFGTYTLTADIVISGIPGSTHIDIAVNVPAAAVPTAIDFQAAEEAFNSGFGSLGTISISNVTVTGDSAEMVAVMEASISIPDLGNYSYVVTYTYTQN